MKNTPKISVCTPLYNTDPVHLRAMIESILGQTYSDFEFLLLNDSPDNKELKKIVQSYKDPRIKYMENDHRMGISGSRNKLIDLARGEYLAIADHDDISLPTRFTKQVAVLDSDSFIGVVSCSWVGMVSKKKYINPQINHEIKPELMGGCVVLHTGAMLRKSVLIDNNIRYEKEFSPAEDYMLWVRLIEHTMFYNIKEVLVKYNDFNGNTSHVQRYEMRDKDMMIKCIAYTKYPYLVAKYNNRVKYWWSLFGIIPLVLVGHSQIRLFGIIPLLVKKIKK